MSVVPLRSLGVRQIGVGNNYLASDSPLRASVGERMGRQRGASQPQSRSSLQAISAITQSAASTFHRVARRHTEFASIPLLAKPLRLRVQVQENEAIAVVTLPPHATASRLKQQVQWSFGVACDRLVVQFHGMILPDECILENCGLVDGSEIELNILPTSDAAVERLENSLPVGELDEVQPPHLLSLLPPPPQSFAHEFVEVDVAVHERRVEPKRCLKEFRQEKECEHSRSHTQSRNLNTGQLPLSPPQSNVSVSQPSFVGGHMQSGIGLGRSYVNEVSDEVVSTSLVGNTAPEPMTLPSPRFSRAIPQCSKRVDLPMASCDAYTPESQGWRVEGMFSSLEHSLRQQPGGLRAHEVSFRAMQCAAESEMYRVLRSPQAVEMHEPDVASTKTRKLCPMLVASANSAANAGGCERQADPMRMHGVFPRSSWFFGTDTKSPLNSLSGKLTTTDGIEPSVHVVDWTDECYVTSGPSRSSEHFPLSSRGPLLRQISHHALEFMELGGQSFLEHSTEAPTQEPCIRSDHLLTQSMKPDSNTCHDASHPTSLSRPKLGEFISDSEIMVTSKTTQAIRRDSGSSGDGRDEFQHSTIHGDKLGAKCSPTSCVRPLPNPTTSENLRAAESTPIMESMTEENVHRYARNARVSHREVQTLDLEFVGMEGFRENSPGLPRVEVFAPREIVAEASLPPFPITTLRSFQASSCRASLVREVFHTLDRDGDGRLNCQELEPYARGTGFDESDADWIEEFNLLCLEQRVDPLLGLAFDQFVFVVGDMQDPNGSHYSCSDDELRKILAVALGSRSHSVAETAPSGSLYHSFHVVGDDNRAALARMAFDLADRDGDGFLSYDEIERIALHSGKCSKEDDWKEEVSYQYSASGSSVGEGRCLGGLDFEAFLEYLNDFGGRGLPCEDGDLRLAIARLRIDIGDEHFVVPSGHASKTLEMRDEAILLPCSKDDAELSPRTKPLMTLEEKLTPPQVGECKDRRCTSSVPQCELGELELVVGKLSRSHDDRDAGCFTEREMGAPPDMEVIAVQTSDCPTCGSELLGDQTCVESVPNNYEGFECNDDVTLIHCTDPPGLMVETENERLLRTEETLDRTGGSGMLGGPMRLDADSLEAQSDRISLEIELTDCDASNLVDSTSSHFAYGPEPRRPQMVDTTVERQSLDSLKLGRSKSQHDQYLAEMSHRSALRKRASHGYIVTSALATTATRIKEPAEPSLAKSASQVPLYASLP